MMNVFIADDESIVLEGLKQIIDWNELGFFICGEAQNGQDALDKILKLQPELVLLDIKMPKLQGTEIVKLARMKNFQGKFIILSGYSNFKYAQIAIEYGVDFYLTKPIDEAELIKAVKSSYNNIIKTQKTNLALSTYREKARYKILHDLLIGKSNFDNIHIDDLYSPSNIYQVIVYENYNHNSFQENYSFAYLLKVANKDNNSFDHIKIDNKEVILLKGSFALDQFKSLLKHYDKGPQKGSPLDSLFLTYGIVVTDLQDIHLSYKAACKLLERRFFCEHNQHVLGYNELPCKEDLNYQTTHEQATYYAQVLSNYIQSFNRKEIVNTLYDLKKNIYFSATSIIEIKCFLSDIYLQIKQITCNVYSSASIPFPTNASIINLIQHKYYLFEIIQFFSEQFEIIMNAIGSSSSESILDDVLYYIDHNFMYNIKLETIAPLFGYNSCYLGKIFRKNVGLNFNSYIEQIRIENAKELLLENDIKVYEVAEQVGYKNVDYFHKKFKKLVGKSPAQYRKMFT